MSGDEMTTERIVRPVRAWAEYDDWHELIDHLGNNQFNVWELPQTGAGLPRIVPGYYQGVVAAVIDAPHGSLRSIRILYENGAELRTGSAANWWEWTLYGQAGDTESIADGSFREDKDSEAVERAMIAAAAWFSQADMERVK